MREQTFFEPAQEDKRKLETLRAWSVMSVIAERSSYWSASATNGRVIQELV